MAEIARSIPKKTREKLIYEAGGKCANPGCDNTRLQIHHIKQWSIYKTHDAKHMIAICPTCHDACHFGRLKITDDQLYQWKKIVKNEEHEEAHIFVSSSSKTLISAGTVAFQQTKERNTVLFDLPSKNKLEFSVNNEYLSVSATLFDRDDQLVFRITNNMIKVHTSKDVILEQRTGKFRVTVPVNKFYLPATALTLMRNREHDYGADGTLTAIDLEVINPGHVRVQGFWPDGNAAIIITKQSINFCRCGGLDYFKHLPTSIVGSGDSTVLLFDGAINEAMFRFE
ncbi:HNH endonuclease signature motif containing protein [Pseudomonas yamanorum]